MINKRFWNGKRVFITGNTGFKGSWLSIWLNSMGAEVFGYSLNPPTKPSLFEVAKVKNITRTQISDVRNLETLRRSILKVKPDIIFHMAAQPLVRESYKYPVETYQTNVMGTVNLLESVRQLKRREAILNITTDKCYENMEMLKKSYRETDPLGGYDPYSSSKACSELITAAYRNSFFNPGECNKYRLAIATARAGNVIGGGDWARDRLVPDIIKGLMDKKTVLIREPEAVRPWQHVLEPLYGYILLAENLYKNGAEYMGSWNFGPKGTDIKNVEWIAKNIFVMWGKGAKYQIKSENRFHEAKYLRLNSQKAMKKLGWLPKWGVKKALKKTMEWYIAYSKDKENMREMCVKQIREYLDEKNKNR